MHFAVLASPDSWYWKDLCRAAEGRHQLTLAAFTQLSACLASGRSRVMAGELELDQFDGVLVRTMPPGSLEQVVFRMDLLGQLEAAGVAVVNSPRSIEAAVDKYLASAKLAVAGFATPRTICCQTVEAGMAAFEQLGGDVVIKPLFGSEGRGLARVDDESLMLRAVKLLTQQGAVLYVQDFIPHHGYDIRLLVIGSQVLGIERRNPTDWRTNVSRGAVTSPCEVTPQLAEQALRAADAVGTTLAGIDLLPAQDGNQYLLEVNAVPGWKAVSSTLKVDVATMVLEHLAEEAGKC